MTRNAAKRRVWQSALPSSLATMGTNGPMPYAAATTVSASTLTKRPMMHGVVMSVHRTKPPVGSPAVAVSVPLASTMVNGPWIEALASTTKMMTARMLEISSGRMRRRSKVDLAFSDHAPFTTWTVFGFSPVAAARCGVSTASLVTDATAPTLTTWWTGLLPENLLLRRMRLPSTSSPPICWASLVWGRVGPRSSRATTREHLSRGAVSMSSWCSCIAWTLTRSM
mmetsp:Transcript_4189/g.9166  ORF Transcript_4189/g.9166 Transcript_4189/m.9166 type:complete len:225 (+) Transcript_4189:647-1321(+)